MDIAAELGTKVGGLFLGLTPGIGKWGLILCPVGGVLLEFGDEVVLKSLGGGLGDDEDLPRLFSISSLAKHITKSLLKGSTDGNGERERSGKSGPKIHPRLTSSLSFHFEFECKTAADT